MIGTFCSVGASDSARAAVGASLICTLGLDAAGRPVDGTRLEIPMQNAKCKPVSTRRAHHQTQVEAREKMTASWTWTCFSIDPNQDPQLLGVVVRSFPRHTVECPHDDGVTLSFRGGRRRRVVEDEEEAVR